MNYDKGKMREYMRGRRKGGDKGSCANCVKLKVRVEELEGMLLIGMPEKVKIKELNKLNEMLSKRIDNKLAEVVERKGIDLCSHGSAKGLCKNGCK